MCSKEFKKGARGRGELAAVRPVFVSLSGLLGPVTSPCRPAQESACDKNSADQTKEGTAGNTGGPWVSKRMTTYISPMCRIRDVNTIIGLPEAFSDLL